MSAAIPCTRAVAQRVAFRTVRCKRFASTEAVAVDAAPATPLPLAKREQRLSPREDLSQRLHKALYPEFYGENGQPINGVTKAHTRRKQPTKPIDAKWQPVMKQKSVHHGLSMYIIPATTRHERSRELPGISMTFRRNKIADLDSQATNSASPSSSSQPATLRKLAPTPSQP